MILNKAHHLISGKGYKCKIERIEMNCTKNWIGSEYCSTSDWLPMFIEEKDCQTMIKEKRCTITTDEWIFSKSMKCELDSCTYYEYPVQKFNWLETNRLSGYKCSLTPVSIIADNLDSNIL